MDSVVLWSFTVSSPRDWPPNSLIRDLLSDPEDPNINLYDIDDAGTVSIWN